MDTKDESEGEMEGVEPDGTEVQMLSGAGSIQLNESTLEEDSTSSGRSGPSFVWKISRPGPPTRPTRGGKSLIRVPAKRDAVAAPHVSSDEISD